MVVKAGRPFSGKNSMISRTESAPRSHRASMILVSSLASFGEDIVNSTTSVVEFRRRKADLASAACRVDREGGWKQARRYSGPAVSVLDQEAAQLLAAARMPQLAQRLGLD